MKEKFNYQIVYKLNNETDEITRVVFVGSTSLSVDDLMDTLDSFIDETVAFCVESVNYGPLNNLENGTKKKT